MLLWPAASLFVLSLGYFGLGAAVLGKRPDGALSPPLALLHLPYLAVTRLIQVIKRRLSSESLYDEVVPGLWIGRRLFEHELPAEAAIVVDVAAEFAETREVLRRVEYHSLPTLNYAAPQAAALRRLVAALTPRREGIYVHCAQGHGRSALVVASLLLARGIARNPEEAEELVIRARPKVHLEDCQREMLRKAGDK